MKKRKNKHSFVCAYCGRSASIEDEPKQQITEVDGKPACIICRSTKLSKFSKSIEKDKKIYNKEKLDRETKSIQDAREDVLGIALASQDKHKKTKINFFK